MWFINRFPMPPTINNSLASIRIGNSFRQIKSVDARAFDKQVQIWINRNEASLKTIRQEIKAKMDDGFQLRIMCYYCFAHEDLWTLKDKPKRLDTNNRIKATLDGIARAIEVDDRHFFGEEHEKVETQQSPPHVMAIIDIHMPNHKSKFFRE